MSNLGKHPTEGEWMAWLDGQLTPGESVVMSEHSSGCHACSEVVEGLRRASAAAPKPIPVPPEFLRESKEQFLRALPAALQPAPEPHPLATSVPGHSGVFRQLPGAIWLVCGLYFVITLGAWALWMTSGEWKYMIAAFGLPYKVFLIFTAASAAALSFYASRQFELRHRLHSAWLLLFAASACRAVGTVASALPTLVPDGPFRAMQSAGELIAGPISFVALGVALLYACRAYRSAGLKASMTIADWLVLAAGTLFTGRHIAEIAGILISGPSKPPIVMLHWLADPALLFILAVAVPLRRMALSHGGGAVAHCWGAIAAGALFTFVGNQLLFLGNYGYLAWPLSSVHWLVWIPAYAAFALGPAYQLSANGQLAERPSLSPQPR